MFWGFRVCFSVVALDSGGSGDVVFSVAKTQHLPLQLHTHTHTHTLSLSLSLSLSLAGIQLPWHYLFNCLLNCTHLDRQTASLTLLVSEIRVWDRVCPPPKKVDLERGGKYANKLKISLFTVQLFGNRLTDTSCRSSTDTFFYVEKLVVLIPLAPFRHAQHSSNFTPVVHLVMEKKIMKCSWPLGTTPHPDTDTERQSDGLERERERERGIGEMDLRGCIIIIALCRLESLLELFPISEISKKGKKRLGVLLRDCLLPWFLPLPFCFLFSFSSFFFLCYLSRSHEVSSIYVYCTSVINICPVASSHTHTTVATTGTLECYKCSVVHKFSTLLLLTTVVVVASFL